VIDAIVIDIEGTTSPTNSVREGLVGSREYPTAPTSLDRLLRRSRPAADVGQRSHQVIPAPFPFRGYLSRRAGTASIGVVAGQAQQGRSYS
jgi:hypothetical protein